MFLIVPNPMLHYADNLSDRQKKLEGFCLFRFLRDWQIPARICQSEPSVLPFLLRAFPSSVPSTPLLLRRDWQIPPTRVYFSSWQFRARRSLPFCSDQRGLKDLLQIIFPLCKQNSKSIRLIEQNNRDSIWEGRIRFFIEIRIFFQSIKGLVRQIKNAEASYEKSLFSRGER